MLFFGTLPFVNAIVAPKAVVPLGEPEQPEVVDLAVGTPETVYRRNHGVGSGYRFYDPSLQRWINQDPLAEGGGINLYAFNYNDPINYVDPDGELPILIPIIIGIGAGTVWANAPGSEHKALNPPEGAPPLAEGASLFLPAPPIANFLGRSSRLLPGVCESESIVIVSRWGRPGLRAGDWVMTGPATKRNYVRSFKWQPGGGNRFTPFRNGVKRLPHRQCVGRKVGE